MRLVSEIVILCLVFGLEQLFPLFKGRKHRARHALSNLAMGALNGAASMLLFSSATIVVMSWAAANSFGLRYQWNLHPWLTSAIVFGLFDFWMYLWHRANHRLSFLWRFHRTHHSDIELDCTTALRFHFGEIAFSSLLRLLVIPLIGVRYYELLLYELILQPIIIFHHSNVALPEKIDRMLRVFIVTPNMHRIHHSQIQVETDSNYSSVFSLWDRLARTFKKRRDTSMIVYGLPYLREPGWQSLAGMLKTPFSNIVMK